MRTIEECFYQIRNGVNIKQGTVDGGYPITRIETIANDKFNRDRMGYAGITDLEKYESYVLEDGDLLMSHINSIQYLGRTVLYKKHGKEKIIHGMNLLRLKARRDIIRPEYAKYYFYSRTFKEKIERITKKSVNQASFAVADLKKIKICVPDLSIQDRVIDILDRVNPVIEERQQELEKLDELIKARFIELFGDPIVNSMSWPEELIGDSCFVTKLAGFEYTQYIHYKDSGDVVMVKAQNVKNGKLNRKDLSYISKAVSDSLPRSQLLAGDVVMTYVGANIGDVAVIDDKYKYHLAPNVAKIRPNAEKYNSIYFMYMLMFLNSYIVGNSADTAKAALGMERIRKLKIFVPPIELQEQFAAFVEQVDKSKVAIQKSLEKTQLLFDSLMQKYFG